MRVNPICCGDMRSPERAWRLIDDVIKTARGRRDANSCWCSELITLALEGEGPVSCWQRLADVDY